MLPVPAVPGGGVGKARRRNQRGCGPDATPRPALQSKDAAR